MCRVVYFSIQYNSVSSILEGVIGTPVQLLIQLYCTSPLLVQCAMRVCRSAFGVGTTRAHWHFSNYEHLAPLHFSVQVLSLQRNLQRWSCSTCSDPAPPNHTPLILRNYSTTVLAHAMFRSFASKTAVTATATAGAVSVMLATSAWRSTSDDSSINDAMKDRSSNVLEKENIRSFSPSLPLVYFQPNPDLEICYDTRTRTPVYALERLRPRSTQSVTDNDNDNNQIAVKKQQRRPHFVEESNLPESFRSRNSHYRQSGYDRGHMAPAGDFQFGQPDTFTLTNACPQHPTLNRTLWNRLEQWVRRVVVAVEDRGARGAKHNVVVMVLTGPLWLPASQGPNNDNTWEYRYPALGQPPSLVSVPTHFFKLVVVVGTHDDDDDYNDTRDGTGKRILQYAAFCVPNRGDKEMENAPLENYLVRWTDLEAVVGMQFFPQLLTNGSDGSHLGSDEWRSLADQATEAVWRRDRLLLLLDGDGASSSLTVNKKNRRAAAAAKRNMAGPQHLCRNGVCK